MEWCHALNILVCRRFCAHNVGCYCMSSTIKCSTEWEAITNAHHSRDVDVGSKLHCLALIAVSFSHALSKLVPVISSGYSIRLFSSTVSFKHFNHPEGFSYCTCIESFTCDSECVVAYFLNCVRWYCLYKVWIPNKYFSIDIFKHILHAVNNASCLCNWFLKVKESCITQFSLSSERNEFFTSNIFYWSHSSWINVEELLVLSKCYRVGLVANAACVYEIVFCISPSNDDVTWLIICVISRAESWSVCSAYSCDLSTVDSNITTASVVSSPVVTSATNTCAFIATCCIYHATVYNDCTSIDIVKWSTYSSTTTSTLSVDSTTIYYNSAHFVSTDTSIIWASCSVKCTSAINCQSSFTSHFDTFCSIECSILAKD